VSLTWPIEQGIYNDERGVGFEGAGSTMRVICRPLWKKIGIKGCPPEPAEMGKALQQAGFQIDQALFGNLESAPGHFMNRYEGSPEFKALHFKTV